MKKTMLCILALLLAVTASVLSGDVEAGASGITEKTPVEETMDAKQRGEALNRQLGLLLAKIYPALQYIDPDIGSYLFSQEVFSQQEYNDLSARIAEVDQLFFDEKGEMIPAYGAGDETMSAAWRLIQSLDLTPRQPDETFIAFIDEVLEDAGYKGFVNRTYQYKHWINKLNEQYGGWQISASDGDLGNASGVVITLQIIGDDRILNLESPFPEYVLSEDVYAYPSHPKALMTEEERQALKDRAVAFCQRYLYCPEESGGVILVSDRAYSDKDGLISPFAGVWLYAPSTPQYFDMWEWPPSSAPFDEAEPGANLGLWFQIDIETGTIYSVSGGVAMSLFANAAHAEADWVALTGQDYPIKDAAYFMNFLARDLIAHYEDLSEAYRAELTDEERLIIRHILSYGIGDENVSYIATDMDWQKLLSDLEACDSLEAFRAVLYGEYTHFNQSPEGEATRDEILKAAEPAIAALGYGDMKLRSFLYSGPVSGGYDGVFHDVVIAKELAAQELWPKEAIIAAFNADGKVRYLDGGMISFHETAPVTDEEKERIAQRVWEVLAQHGDFPGAPVKSLVRVADEAGKDSSGNRFVKAYVVLDKGPSWASGANAVALILDVDTERVMHISLYLADFVEEYFMNSMI